MQTKKPPHIVRVAIRPDIFLGRIIPAVCWEQCAKLWELGAERDDKWVAVFSNIKPKHVTGVYAFSLRGGNEYIKVTDSPPDFPNAVSLPWHVVDALRYTEIKSGYVWAEEA